MKYFNKKVNKIRYIKPILRYERCIKGHCGAGWHDYMLCTRGKYGAGPDAPLLF